MSSVEDVVKRILALRPELTREAVQMMIEEEKSRSGGLLTEEAAAHIVASILGLQAGQRVEAKTRIGKLTSGLGDVSITARVICIFPARRFMRRDGREGKVMRMLLGDSTGTVAAVLWDEKADLISAGKVQSGKVLRILHGYTRERQGETEINVGRRGEIYLEPMDLRSEDLPPAETFFLKPREIRKAGKVHLTAVIIEKRPASTFKRSDGTEGRVMRMRIGDLEAGELTVVLWDDRVDDVGAMEVGTRVRMLDGRAREGAGGSIEVHVSRSTWVEAVETGVDVTKALKGGTTRISDIKSGMRDINLVARVAATGEVRTFNRRGADEGRVASLLLQDETGSIRMSLWDSDTLFLETVHQGDIVEVEKAYAREGLGGLNLSLGSDGRIALSQKEYSMPQSMVEVARIEDLQDKTGNVNLRGRVVEAPSIREVRTQRGDTVRVASFVIDDGTGEARVSVWRDLVREVETLSLGANITIENCYVRPSYTERKEVTSGTFTKIRTA